MIRPRRFMLSVALLALGTVACADVFTAGAAVVNGQSISQEDVDQRVRAASQTPQPDPAIERQALQQLIEEALVLQEARDRRVEVPETDVDAQLGQIRAQFPNDQAFQEALQSRGFTEASLKDAIRDQLVRDRLGVALAGEIADADLRQVYEAEIERFTEVRARHILLRITDPAREAEVRARAQTIRRRLREGESFAALAERFGEDDTASRGGDLGFLSLGELVPEFAGAVAEAEIGELVGPVRTQFGYHLIEVLERRVKPFAEVREEVRAQLETQAGERALGEFLSEELKRAKIAVNPRYGDWDPETLQIVPHQSFVPPSPEPDPNAPPGIDLFPPPTGQTPG